MDYQAAFNLAMGIAAFFGGWTLKRIHIAIDRLDKDVRNLPAYYLRKDDYRQDLHRIESMLNKIFERLEDKQDKP
ncbi:MAG: hypothetical protein VKK05_09180 [Synechococcus sp.]|nr:hypothetical protein [Synechococcus sp.]